MGSKQIKDFSAITTLQNGDLFLVQQAADNVNKKITSADIATYINGVSPVMPVGALYIQHYGKSDPATLFGGTWAKRFDTEAVFFRTEGSASTTFEARAFDANIQDSQMQGHWHNIYSENANAPVAGLNTGSGAWGIPISVGSTVDRIIAKAPSSDGTNGTPRTGAETRPRNRCIRIWERTA